MEVSVGMKFGFLEVVALKNAHHFGNSWICRCVCGKEFKIYEANLFDQKIGEPQRVVVVKRNHKTDQL